MIEKIVERNGEKAVEVRSDGGKLLFVKTKAGYEMKCPRTKQICLIKYQEMISDCLQCWAGVSGGDKNPFFSGPETNKVLEKAKSLSDKIIR